MLYDHAISAAPIWRACANQTYQLPLDMLPGRVYRLGVQTAETSTAQAHPVRSSFADDPKQVNQERARLAREARAIKRLQGRISKMDREQAIKHMERLLKDKNTPVQYHAAIMSQLADLNSWKRQPDDASARVSIDEMLNAWKREDNGGYAGLLNQVASDNKVICQPVNNHASAQPGKPHASSDISALNGAHMPSPSTQVSTVGDRGMGEGGAGSVVRPGGSPQAESAAESLDPLTRPTSPEKVSLVTDSKGVNANQPEDGWVE